MPLLLTQKSQVTIPKSVRERLGIGPGDPIDIVFNDRGEAVIVPLTPQPGQSRFAWARGIAGPGMTTEEVMRLTRGEE
ncbi:MAG: AbrB/MazE/SpoVT family DNA-binding domain-containing protein [Alphaproteobacteria bacterium]|jgi:antitoxin PrlF|nr:AbrB/MazE/SpoVT family DNA-binding domain-containing protein [Alphaproteobacteria bacterium]